MENIKKPKVSICVPFHWMENWPFFLERCLNSIEKQTFKDYEIILIKHSIMPITSNRVIESATGEIIKVLYMDDWLASPNYLEEISKAFENKDFNAWKTLMTGRGRVTQVINAQNFTRFAEAHELAEQGKIDEAKQIRTELGLGLQNGSGQGHGMEYSRTNR